MPKTSGYYTPPDDDESPEKSTSMAAESGNEDGDRDMEGQTTLVSNSVFPGGPPKMGDVCKFEIVHVYEDESEIRYVKEDGMKSGQAREAMHGRMDKYAEGME